MNKALVVLMIWILPLGKVMAGELFVHLEELKQICSLFEGNDIATDKGGC